MRFLGYDLDLTVDTILDGEDGPRVFTAHDDEHLMWVVAQIGHDPSNLAWLCAPVSDQAARAVMKGGVDPHDAIRHSLTGTVELVTVRRGETVPDQCLLCSDVSEEFLTSFAPIASPDSGPALSLAG